MKERPILFSAPMVKAILAGTKSQTRRIVKWKPREPGLNLDASSLSAGHYFTGQPDCGWVLRSMGGSCWHDRTYPARSPYGGPGSRIWVKETHWRLGKWVKDGLSKTGRQKWRFRATKGEYVRFVPSEERPAREEHGWHKRPSLFMPRNLSRITLEVTGVRVERLQDISETDAIAEGCKFVDVPADCQWSEARDLGMQIYKFTDNRTRRVTMFGPRAEYAALWEKINGAGSWDANLWVWVIEFRRLPL